MVNRSAGLRASVIPKWFWDLTFLLPLFPHKTKSCSATVIYFGVLLPTVSLSLLKISMQETLYAVVEFEHEDNVCSTQHSPSCWRERAWWVEYPPSGQRQVSKWWETIPQTLMMLLQNYHLQFEDEETEAETSLCYTMYRTWILVYMVPKLDTFLTPWWIKYWELRRWGSFRVLGNSMAKCYVFTPLEFL